MRAKEAHFRTPEDSLGQLVWVVDGQGRLSYGNLAWQSFTQIHVGAPFVESYVPAVHPAGRSSWEQTWERAVSSRGILRVGASRALSVAGKLCVSARMG
jgi:hypothetical protein